MNNRKYAPNSYQGNALFMHLTHTTTYIPLRLLLLYLPGITDISTAVQQYKGLRVLKMLTAILTTRGKHMKYFYRVHHSKTPSNFDIQFYQGPPGKIQPLDNTCFTFTREELIRMRDELDSFLGNCPPTTLDEMRQAITEVQTQLDQFKYLN
jgi:hypothetical protein